MLLVDRANGFHLENPLPDRELPVLEHPDILKANNATDVTQRREIRMV